MTCEANVTKAKQLTLQVRDDLDTAWEIVGGVQDRGFTFDNPVEVVTSSSTTTDYNESEFTGFANVTLNMSGVADKRTGITDPATGLNIVGSQRILELASTGQRCAQVRMFNVDTGGFIEGFFNITSFAKTGSTPGLLSFDATLESKADIIVSGDV